MKHVWLVILLAPLLSACNKSATMPPLPIPMYDVKKSVVRQLSERFPSYSFFIKQTDFHADSTYTVHVTITHQGTKKVHSMKLLKHVDEKNPKWIYSGEIPIELFGEENPQGKTFFKVYLEQPEKK